MRKSPSLPGRKSTPTPKFLGTAVAYSFCHISPNFQISLIYAFIECPQSVFWKMEKQSEIEPPLNHTETKLMKSGKKGNNRNHYVGNPFFRHQFHLPLTRTGKKFRNQWYFVSKIVLTCYKKNCSIHSEKTFEIRG